MLVSNLQFAYKAEHSTSQCTWLVKEVITYFKNNGSNVCVCLLGCSKAFDKIKPDVLFKKLYDKDLSPLTISIIMNMYLYGSVQVRWDSTTSHSFKLNSHFRFYRPC